MRLNHDVERGGGRLGADVRGAQRAGEVEEGVGVSHGVQCAGWRGRRGGGRGCRRRAWRVRAWQLEYLLAIPGVGARTETAVWIFGANLRVKRLDSYGRPRAALPQKLFVRLHPLLRELHAPAQRDPMAPFRGRGGFRGRPRARARGRGGARAAPRDQFTKARIEDPESDSDSPDVRDEPMQSEPEDETSSDEEDDDQPATADRPYSALLRSLQQTVPEGPKKKRRKLDHQSAASPPPVEPGEDPEPEADADDEDAAVSDDDGNDGDEEDLSDPFEAHFARPDENELSEKLKAISEKHWETRKTQLPGLGRCAILTPGAPEPPKKPASAPNQLKIKHKLASRANGLIPEFNDLQKGLATPLFAYQDVLFASRTPKNAESLRQITCLHALNHIFKTRDKVLKNNARLTKEQDNGDVELRDQGFTRPKVLMLLETRQACVRTVDTIMQLCEPEQQENKKRFLESFSQSEDRFSDDKPEDFRELFEGNDDNEYRFGLKFTRKTVKYFSQFYNSDIIFASPLGLRRAIERGGE